jgi:hypothetical protein
METFILSIEITLKQTCCESRVFTKKLSQIEHNLGWAITIYQKKFQLVMIKKRGLQHYG